MTELNMIIIYWVYQVYSQNLGSRKLHPTRALKFRNDIPGSRGRFLYLFRPCSQARSTKQASFLIHHSPTSVLTNVAAGGIEVKSTVMVPKRLMDRLDRAAARGSVRRSTAVPMALELMPWVTPRVT